MAADTGEQVGSVVRRYHLSKGGNLKDLSMLTTSSIGNGSTKAFRAFMSSSLVVRATTRPMLTVFGYTDERLIQADAVLPDETLPIGCGRLDLVFPGNLP